MAGSPGKPFVARFSLNDPAFWFATSHRVLSRPSEKSGLIVRANALLKLLVDGETGMRGYLVTGDAMFLEPYYYAEENNVGSTFEGLMELVSDDAAQVKSLKVLRTDHEEWRQFARLEIEIRRDGGDLEARIRTGEGKRRMDSMREQVAAFIDVEERLREDRIWTARCATWIVVGVSLTVLV